MKFTWLHWLIVGLVVGIIYLILSRPGKPDSQAVVNARDSTKKLLEANVINSMQVKTLEIRLANTLVKSSVDSARFVKEITLKDQQLAKKRVRIDTLFKDNPVLQDYLVTADSVFAMMSERIDTLQSEKAFQQTLYNELIYIKDKQISNWQMVSSQKDVIIADQAKQLKKKSPKRLGNILKNVGKVGAIGFIGWLIGKG